MSNTTTPKGWKLVPVEPTLEMLGAGGSRFSSPFGAYTAMLAAAPDAPAQTASAEQVTPEMIRAGQNTKAGRFVCSGVPGGHGYLTELYLAMRSAAPPAPAVEPLTDERIDAAVQAWFQRSGRGIVPPDAGPVFRARMRAALDAALAPKEGGAA